MRCLRRQDISDDEPGVQPAPALRLAGKTVPAPGSDVEVLAPSSAQDFKLSSA
jgi:hypothetical protein